MYLAYRLSLFVFLTVMFSFSVSGMVAVYKELHPSPQMGIIRHQAGIPYVRVPGGWQRIHYP